MFLVSKIAWMAATPSLLLPLLVLIGALMMRTATWRKAGRRTAIAAGALFFILPSPPVLTALQGALQHRFAPPAPSALANAEGFIVLGGATSQSRWGPEINEAGDRVVAAATLAHAFPDKTLVFSGGVMRGDFPSEAHDMAQMAEALGVARGRMQIEPHSRTTFENATLSAQLLGERARKGEWVIVTSGWHMPRAIGCFRKAGVRVIAYPVDYRRAWRDEAFFDWRLGRALLDLDTIAKEYVGLISYYLAGRTDALFPAPQ